MSASKSPAQPPAGSHFTRLHHFHGGLVLASHSELSTSQPVSSAGIPDELVIPLQQHVGELATPRVSPGDTVLKGQQIAAPSDHGLHPSVAVEELPGRIQGVDHRHMSEQGAGHRFEATGGFHVESLADTDVLIPTMCPVTADMLSDCPRLRLIQQCRIRRRERDCVP